MPIDLWPGFKHGTVAKVKNVVRKIGSSMPCGCRRGGSEDKVVANENVVAHDNVVTLMVVIA